ncbi:MAG: glycosyltransferase [Thermoproteota archaeon]
MAKKSTKIFMSGIVVAVLATAFVVSQNAVTSIQDVQATDDNQSKEALDKHSKKHIPSFAASNDLNQTKVTELRIALHDLWVEHVVWTRQYIVAASSDSPDASFAAERLLKNQEDIGDAIKPFYGDRAGDQLTGLLKDHILIAVDLLEAAKAGDATGVEEIEEKWYRNADDIATFLSSANPNWTKEEMTSMVNEHLSLTKTEAVARLTGDYATDVTTFDALYKHAVSMSDEFTIGIVKQFEEQFEVDRNSSREN